MAYLSSVQWNLKEGVCKKHLLPSVPCPACIAEGDPDITLVVTRSDAVAMEWDDEITLADIAPVGAGVTLREPICGIDEGIFRGSLGVDNDGVTKIYEIRLRGTYAPVVRRADQFDFVIV